MPTTVGGGGVCPGLGHQGQGATLSRTAAERLLGLACDARKMVEIGTSWPLLVIIIRDCGVMDNCVISYHGAARECAVSHGTIKNWGERLVKLDLVKKIPRGQGGVCFRLNVDRIERAGVFGDFIAQMQAGLCLLEAATTTAVHALDDLGEHLRDQIEAFE